MTESIVQSEPSAWYFRIFVKVVLLADSSTLSMSESWIKFTAFAFK